MDNKKPTHTRKNSIKTFWNRISKSLSTEQKEKILPLELPPEKCSYCGSFKIKWKNSVVFDYACDECVPRGCSCNLYKQTDKLDFDLDDYSYNLDENGEEIPCEDWYRL